MVLHFYSLLVSSPLIGNRGGCCLPVPKDYNHALPCLACMHHHAWNMCLTMPGMCALPCLTYVCTTIPGICVLPCLSPHKITKQPLWGHKRPAEFGQRTHTFQRWLCVPSTRIQCIATQCNATHLDAKHYNSNRMLDMICISLCYSQYLCCIINVCNKGLPLSI